MMADDVVDQTLGLLLDIWMSRHGMYEAVDGDRDLSKRVVESERRDYISHHLQCLLQLRMWCRQHLALPGV